MTGQSQGQFKVGNDPDNEILLRWTAAYKEEVQKLARTPARTASSVPR